MVYAQDAVLDEKVTEQGDWLLEVQMRRADLERMLHQDAGLVFTPDHEPRLATGTHAP